jgi:hypothetical protein
MEKSVSIENAKKIIGMLLDDEGLIDVVRVALSTLFGEENVLWRKDGECYDDKYCESEYIVRVGDNCYKVVAVIDTDVPAVADVKYAEIPQQICRI